MPWPTERWPEGPPDADVDRRRLDAVYRALVREPRPERTGETRALLCIHRGRLVAEAYSGDRDGEPYGPELPQISWSMAKSITHALVGILVRQGRLDPEAPAPIAAWQGPGDPRAQLTTEHLMRMVDGLDYVEEYVEGRGSDVIEMLFRSGQEDVVAYAASRPSERPPGRWWNYSSGTSCLVAHVVARIVGGGETAMREFMQRELFEPIGMRTAAPRFDPAGNFIGSSFVWASARDFARFGLLYLRDGVWDGQQILARGWVDHARRLTPASFDQYGAHWWLAQDRSGIFSANGFRGQYTIVVPTRDLVIVRLGDTETELQPALKFVMRDLCEAFPLLS